MPDTIDFTTSSAKEQLPGESFLIFTGRAEEAMQFYASSLPETEIAKLIRYGKEHPYANTLEFYLPL